METKIVELRVNTNLDQTNSDVTKLKSNLKGAESGAKDFDKAIGTKKGGSFKELGGAIGDIIPSFGAASQGAGVLNKALLTLVANPIGAVVAAVVLAIVGLVAIFKSFQPVVDKVEQSLAALGSVLNVIKNTFIAVFTGTKSLGEAFKGLGGEMSSAAKRTMELVKAQQDLEDVLAQQEVQTSRTRAEINKLNVQAKNRALSEEQRLALLKKASVLEDQDFKARRKNADEEVRQAREAIAIKAGFNAKEIKLLKEQGLAVKELAESKGGNYDEEFKRLATAQKNRISLEDESTADLEKNQNKQDALFEKQQAKREKEIADAQIRADKLLAIEKAKQDAINAFQKDVLTNQQKMNVDKVNTEIQDALEEKDRKQKSLEDISAMVDAIETENTNKLKLETDARIKIGELEVQAKQNQLAGIGNALAQAAQIAGESTSAGKALAIASTTISTYSAAQKAYESAFLPVPTVASPALGAVFAGVAVAGGLMNIKKILSVKTPKGGGGGGSAPSVGGSPSAPSFNVVGTSGQNQIAQTLNREHPPVKAYVVANDVTTQQGLTRNIVKSASI